MATRASKAIQVTSYATGEVIAISCNKIIKYTLIGANDTLMTYISQSGKIVDNRFTETVAAITALTASDTQNMFQPITLVSSNTLINGVIMYINNDRVLYLNDTTTTLLVTYDAGNQEPFTFESSSPATSANYVTNAGNMFPVTMQPSNGLASAVRYINNLNVGIATAEVMQSPPIVTFTTELRSGPNTAALVAGTGYTNPTVAVVGGGGAGATGTLSTKAITVAVVNGGTGGTPGAVTITGTTGTGTPFQATGTIDGGGILAGALVVTVAGDYTVPVTNIASEPVTGGGLVGCTVSVSLGINEFIFGAAGTGYTSYPTFVITDATGINGSVVRAMTVESPLVIAFEGVGVNANPILTFTAGGTTATATGTATNNVLASTSLTQAGSYTSGTHAYPALSISGGGGCQILYDDKKVSFTRLQVQDTLSAVIALVNAL